MANLNGNARTGYKAKDPRMKRLFNTETRKYLHTSGSGEVQTTDFAWFGYAYQADTLEQRAKILKEPWPYVFGCNDEGEA